MFHRYRMGLACAALIAGSIVFPSAFACSPPPITLLPKLTTIDAKLPLIHPALIPPSITGMCPTQVWPFQFDALSDAQITQYLGAGGTSNTGGALDPAWQSTKVYVAGDRASYNGKNYRAKWWTQGEIPGSASSGVWEEVVAATGNPPAWSASTAYTGGAQVSYNGNIYSAKWWTQGETPGVAGNAWTLVGPMQSVTGSLPSPYHVSISAPASNQSTLSWSTGTVPFTGTVKADNWQLRINGAVVQSGTNIPTYIADCPTPAPGSMSTCQGGYSQGGSVTVPWGATTDQITFWVCAGTACRPTPRINFYQNTVDAP